MVMDRKEYRNILAEIGMSQTEAGEFLMGNGVTGRRWAVTGVTNKAAAKLLRLMAELGFAPAYVEGLIERRLRK